MAEDNKVVEEKSEENTETTKDETTTTENGEEILEINEEADSLDDAETEIQKLKQENQEQYDRFLRLQAEYENFKRRSQKEKNAERKYKSQELANELLPVLDNFERALQVEKTDATEGIIEGITMVYQQLLNALQTQGIEEIKTTEEQFDPNLHHAVMQVEDDEFESNEVVEVLQKGYMIKDRVLRPAMVKVNK